MTPENATTGEREVAAFANEMKRKLALRALKGGWKGESPEMLLAALLEELNELIEALYPEEGGPDVDAVRAEAADVANYAMMIADVVGGSR